MTEPRAVRCLDDDLGEYAAGRLEPARRRRWDLHLVSCRVCVHAVDEERRLQTAFAGAPSMPGDLRATLLALAAVAGPAPAAVTQPVRRRDPLAVLSPSAPPCHRSALRATVVAAAAAGASAAAALSLTVISTPAGRTGLITTTAVPAVGSPSPPTAAYGGVAAAVPVGWARTGGATASTRQAESRP